MVVTKKQYEINGNAALVPKRKAFEESEELKRLRKSKEEYLRRKKQAELKNRASIMLSIICVFVMGFTVIYRYSSIYDMQGNLTSLNSQIQNTNKDNDSLRMQLAQYNNLDYIEQKASALNMVQPDKNSAVYVDLNKENIKSTPSENNSKKQMSFLELIKNKLF